MTNLKIIYEKYNLLIDQKMYGDGSLTYRYDENGEFQNILTELTPYAAIGELPNIRFQPEDVWKDSTIWPTSDTPPKAILTALFDTMVVKLSTHSYQIEFVSRRTVFTFSLEKGGKTYNFWLIHENAPFDQDPTFRACKRVQEVGTYSVSTYSYDTKDEDIVNDILSNIS